MLLRLLRLAPACPLPPILCAAPVSGLGTCSHRGSHAMCMPVSVVVVQAGQQAGHQPQQRQEGAKLYLPLCGASCPCKRLCWALQGSCCRRSQLGRHSLRACGSRCTCNLPCLHLQGSNSGGSGRRGQLFRHSLPRMGDTNTTTAFGNLNLKDIASSLGSSSSRASPPPPSPFAGAPAFNQDNQSSFQDTSSAGGELLRWPCSCLAVPTPLGL